MRSSLRPFSGRVIFDHIPKTAGQAITTWLRDVLGDGTVSPNLVTSHGDALKSSAHYPVVSGHVFFKDGEGLDPRFQYATLLREPLDRTISWLFFVTRNHKREQLPQLYDECEAFLESDGDDLQPFLSQAIKNPMVVHYARVLGTQDRTEHDLVEIAWDVLHDYDCVGIYERLTDFMSELATLIGVPMPTSLHETNVTHSRPNANSISDKLRENILGITTFDQRLYARVADLVSRRAMLQTPPPTVSKWMRFDQPKDKPSR